MNHTKILMIILILSAFGCDGFLDEKPSKDLVIPTTIQDLVGMLDNQNQQMNNSTSLTLSGTDDLWTTSTGLQSFNSVPAVNSYLWEKEIYDVATGADWIVSYRQMFYANVVLEELKNLDKESGQEELASVKGTALFMRGKALHDLLQMYAPVYTENKADSELGVVIRTSAKITDKQGRATLGQCYAQVLRDLNDALEFLPEKTIFPSRPNLAAGYAMLSRVYLTMSRYPEAGQHASRSIELQGDLVNYNELDAEELYPFGMFNKEVIYFSVMTSQNYHFSSQTYVDSLLVDSYDSADLRRDVFFRQVTSEGWNFRGSYTGGDELFSGLGVDEMYLTLAETEVRAGRVNSGMEYLNHLLEHRYREGAFIPIEITDGQDALETVLGERRKELVFRGTRWSDLRRLNLEPAFQKELVRLVDGKEYRLKPNSPRYVYPIPQEEIDLNDLTQNVR